MKIYLAAKYSDMMLMRDVRDRLVAAGHEITSQWIDGKEKTDAGSPEATLLAAAIMDVGDVLRANALVAFSHERGALHTGGGRHVEFGVALQAAKHLVVCGPLGEHVFHHWPTVRHCADVDALIEHLRETRP